MSDCGRPTTTAVRSRRGTPLSLPTVLATVVACALVIGGCGGRHAGDLGATSMRSERRPTTTVEPEHPTVDPSTPSGHDAPAGITADWRPATLDWRSCDGDGQRRAPGARQCATLPVPLDWADPSGPSIDLALARIPATGGPAERLGSVVTDPGGPGGSGVEFVASSPFDGTVARRFDQVGWDPRGVGGSSPITCAGDSARRFLEADPDPDTPDEQAHLEELARQVSADCAADAPVLAHISTVDVARDLEAIRRALGDEPLNYVGFSYGTQIGQTYAQMYPTRIRTMVLDGVVDPSLSFTDFLMGQIDGFDAAFDREASACVRAGATACGVADLAAAYDELHARVEATPVPAGRGRTLGPADLAVAATYVGYGSDGWRRLGPALRRGLTGDGSALVALADSYHDLGGYAAYAGVVCSDTPPPPDAAAWKAFADAARARSPRFGGSVANELLPCATWPVKATGAPRPVTAPGAPPIVVVGNTGDPATPLANATAVAGRLGSGRLVTADISGHTAYGSDACVTDLVDRYIVDRTAPADGTTC